MVCLVFGPFLDLLMFFPGDFNFSRGFARPDRYSIILTFRDGSIRAIRRPPRFFPFRQKNCNSFLGISGPWAGPMGQAHGQGPWAGPMGRAHGPGPWAQDGPVGAQAPHRRKLPAKLFRKNALFLGMSSKCSENKKEPRQNSAHFGVLNSPQSFF